MMLESEWIIPSFWISIISTVILLVLQCKKYGVPGLGRTFIFLCFPAIIAYVPYKVWSVGKQSGWVGVDPIFMYFIIFIPLCTAISNMFVLTVMLFAVAKKALQK